MKQQHLEEYASPKHKPTLFTPKTNAGNTLRTHNIDATLGLCHMLLDSWIDTAKPTIISAQTKTKPAQVIHPTFDLKLPGTKTKLFLKTAYHDKDWQMIIYDELMNFNYDHNHDQPNLFFPHASDPHVASSIFVLLEYHLSGKLSQTVKSLEIESDVYEFQLEDTSTIEKTLRAIKVTGKKNIIDFSCVLHSTFIANKGKTIPLEDDITLPLSRTKTI